MSVGLATNSFLIFPLINVGIASATNLANSGFLRSVSGEYLPLESAPNAIANNWETNIEASLPLDNNLILPGNLSFIWSTTSLDKNTALGAFCTPPPPPLGFTIVPWTIASSIPSFNLILFSAPGIFIFLTPAEFWGVVGISLIFLGSEVFASLSPNESWTFAFTFTSFSISPYPEDLCFPFGSLGVPKPGASVVYPTPLTPNSPSLV